MRYTPRGNLAGAGGQGFKRDSQRFQESLLTFGRSAAPVRAATQDREGLMRPLLLLPLVFLAGCGEQAITDPDSSGSTYASIERQLPKGGTGKGLTVMTEISGGSPYGASTLAFSLDPTTMMLIGRLLWGLTSFSLNRWRSHLVSSGPDGTLESSRIMRAPLRTRRPRRSPHSQPRPAAPPAGPHLERDDRGSDVPSPMFVDCWTRHG